MKNALKSYTLLIFSDLKLPPWFSMSLFESSCVGDKNEVKFWKKRAPSLGKLRSKSINNENIVGYTCILWH